MGQISREIRLGPDRCNEMLIDRRANTLSRPVPAITRNFESHTVDNLGVFGIVRDTH